MKRILLTIEYDGTAYSGWQRQYNGLAVQQVVEEALGRACHESITVTGASRTDAGVHALGQAPKQLLKIAEDMGIENPSQLNVQQLRFAVLRAHAADKKVMMLYF